MSHNSDPPGTRHKKLFGTMMEGPFQLGIRGRTLKFIVDFLFHRAYPVRIGNTLSSNRANICVPDSSVLSPMLFHLV